MTCNPYQSSAEPALIHAAGISAVSREELRVVSRYQRRLLSCLAAHLLFVVLSSTTRYSQVFEVRLLVYGGLVLTWFAGAALVYRLATKLYGNAMAVQLGLLASFPIFGLLVLMMVYSKGNVTLRGNGIEVGFLGANPSQI